MKFYKTKSTTFYKKIGIYFDCETKTLVILFKEKRYYIFF